MKNGGGGGYQNWLRESREYFVKTAAETVRLTDSTVSAGLFAAPAELSGESGGVVKYADFVMYNMPYASDKSDKAATSAQPEIYGGGKPFYLYYSVADGSENVTADILRQLSRRKSEDGYSGCAFATYGVLSGNKGELAVLLSRYFENLLNEQ